MVLPMSKPVNTGISEAERQKIIGIIHALLPGCKIYLFGSRARGMHDPSSDIAVDTGAPIKPRIKVGEIQEVLKGLYTPYTFQVLDLHMATNLMKQNILKEGILWSN
jgi:predicted nucleotidyltransferase